MENFFLEPFLCTSSLSFFYQIICFLANIISIVGLVLKGRKIVFRGLLFRLGENFLEFFLVLIGLFFSRRKR